MSKRRCDNCAYYVELEEAPGQGVCRERLFSGITIQGDTKGWFAPVKPEWWCGKFRAVEAQVVDFPKRKAKAGK